MTKIIPYNCKPTHAHTIGLVVLQTDETVEDEFRFYLNSNPQLSSSVNVLHSRIPADDTISVTTLAQMKNHLNETLARFPAKKSPLQVITYACTSGATIIGEEVVNEMISKYATHASNALTAVKAALRALSARRLAFLTPYVSEVSQRMGALLQAEGITLAATASFNQPSDAIVASIDPASIQAAVIDLVHENRSENIDAVFIACTNLKCASIIPTCEAALNIPVISSNQALIWHALRLAAVPHLPAPQHGTLFTRPLMAKPR